LLMNIYMSKFSCHRLLIANNFRCSFEYSIYLFFTKYILLETISKISSSSACMYREIS
jgi:hypothetical protein